MAGEEEEQLTLCVKAVVVRELQFDHFAQKLRGTRLAELLECLGRAQQIPIARIAIVEVQVLDYHILR